MRSEGDDTSFMPREIVQSRDITLAEAKVLTRVITRKYMRNLKRDIWFRLALIAHCFGMAMLAVGALQLSYLYRCCSPTIFQLVVAATVLYIGGMIVYHLRYLRGIGLLNKSASPAGSRHLIDAQGYSIARGGQRTFIPWHAIVEIDPRPGLFLTATSAVHFWPITKAAFADQDVDGFCVKLQRRWSAARERAA
jgi:hypothetical protein